MILEKTECHTSSAIKSSHKPLVFKSGDGLPREVLEYGFKNLFKNCSLLKKTMNG